MTQTTELPGSLEGVLREYLAELRQSFDEYNSNQDNHGRAGVVQSLQATRKFIHAVALTLPINERLEIARLAEPFAVAAISIHDLQIGSVHPLLRPSEIHNRRTLPSAIRCSRGIATVAMEILMLAGAERGPAARHVANQTLGSEMYDGIRRSEWKAVAAWRDQIRATTPRVSLDD